MNKNIKWEKIEKCTIEEREKLIPYIDNLINLKCNSEKYGVYGFNDYFNNGNIFEKSALNLVIQGYMPDVIEKILYNLLSSSDIKNIDYLKNIIFTEFILILQKATYSSNSIIKGILISYLGVDCAKDFHKNPLEINPEYEK